jgi:hypothetical protein
MCRGTRRICREIFTRTMRLPSFGTSYKRILWPCVQHILWFCRKTNNYFFNRKIVIYIEFGGINTMPVIERALKNWKVVCPGCGHIQFSEKEKNCNCDNCHAPALMSYGFVHKSRWENDQARRSYRKLQCSNGCGWFTNKVICTKCKAAIEGDYFQGETTGCFVATACYEDENHPTVLRLRKFRDHHLNNSFLGRYFIDFYWKIGPFLAKIVNKSPRLKAFTRVILNSLSGMLPL